MKSFANFTKPPFQNLFIRMSIIKIAEEDYICLFKEKWWLTSLCLAGFYVFHCWVTGTQWRWESLYQLNIIKDVSRPRITDSYFCS